MASLPAPEVQFWPVGLLGNFLERFSSLMQSNAREERAFFFFFKPLDTAG